MSSGWKCLSVREFINQCNWENIPLETSAESVAQLKQSLANWQCLTSQDFFALHNWSGQAVFTDSLRQSGGQHKVLNLTLNTGRFWHCFNWLGDKKTIAPEKEEEILEHTEQAIAEVEEFTLKDLSQLF